MWIQATEVPNVYPVYDWQYGDGSGRWMIVGWNGNYNVTHYFSNAHLDQYAQIGG